MRSSPRPARRTLRTAAAVTAATMLSGCAMGLESLPLPARQTSGETFVLNAVFDNALNLPDKAKVKLNGADIGEVTDIRAEDFNAYVTMRIKSDVPVFVGSKAELRSATPLGDVFVAIQPDLTQGREARQLRDGDTIGLESTEAASTVEEVLTSASLLVNGGTVRRLVTVLNGTGAAVGGKGAKIADLLRQSNDLLAKLNGRSEQIRAALDNTADLAATLSARQKTLNEVVAAAAPATEVIADNIEEINQLTDITAAISAQLSRFPSLQGTDTRSVLADVNRVAAVGNDIMVDPDLSIYSFNRLLPILMKISNSTGAHVNTSFAQLAIGNHPDMNYPGDPAMHGPDGTDWHAMVGSLRYEWNLLLSKIYGPQR